MAVVPVLASILRRKLVPDEEKEHLRRSNINDTGRIATGLVTEFRGDTVYFDYFIGGIEYLATQDISAFRNILPAEDDHLMVGPCSLKYLIDNPANSIVICEGWNGLRSSGARIRSSDKHSAN